MMKYLTICISLILLFSCKKEQFNTESKPIITDDFRGQFIGEYNIYYYDTTKNDYVKSGDGFVRLYRDSDGNSCYRNCDRLNNEYYKPICFIENTDTSKVRHYCSVNQLGLVRDAREGLTFINDTIRIYGGIETWHGIATWDYKWVKK